MVNALNNKEKKIYEFDDFELDPAERRFARGGEPLQLAPKVFDTLVVLVENNNRLIEKETLLSSVWADSFVEEGNLKIAVHALRKVLNGSNYIETVPKKGYRFNAPVRVIERKPEEFLLEKQTVSKITIGAREVEENPEKPAAASHTQTFNFSRTKIYLTAFLTLGLFLCSAFYYAKSRQTQKQATVAANPLAGVRTLAVLPLKSLSVPPGEQELRVGMTDSIVTKLAAVRQIAVRPTSATIRYLDKDYDLKEVGKDLNVDSILEGSIQTEGQKLKINLQMVGVADGKVLWADTFTNDLSNFLNGQESVANRVSRLMLLNSNADAPDYAAPPNLSAQELYLKARYAMATSARKIQNVFQARDFYEQAIRLDANYAPAYAGLASNYALAASLNLLSPREAYPKVETYARRALEIDPNSAEAHSNLAEVETNYNWNWQAADAEYRRALELNPNAAGIHEDYAEFLARMGRFEEAEYQGDMAHQLDPTAINIEAVKALHYCYARRFDEAAAQSEMVVAKDSDAYLAYLYLALSEDALGNYDKAEAAAAKAAAITGGAPPDLFAAGSTSALRRDGKKTQEILTKLEEASRRQYVDPFYFAMIYAVSDDNEKAFEYLEKCRAEKSYWMTTLKVFPFLEGLRSDARFANLLQQLKLND